MNIERKGETDVKLLKNKDNDDNAAERQRFFPIFVIPQESWLPRFMQKNPKIRNGAKEEKKESICMLTLPIANVVFHKVLYRLKRERSWQKPHKPSYKTKNVNLFCNFLTA